MAISPCNTVTDERGYEITAHGTASFPVGCYRDNLIVDPVPWHWHDELEAVVVEEGEAIFVAGSEKHLLQKGDGIMINAGVLHTVLETEKACCFLHSLCFHPRLIGGSPDSVFWLKYLLPLLTDTSFTSIHLTPEKEWQREALAAIESTWQACAHEPPGYEFQARSLLSYLVWLTASSYPPAKPPLSEKAVRDRERIKSMLQYIHDHYSEELDTAQIAGSALISASECLRCFRSTIGTTPIQYLKLYRIQQAALLLAEPTRKISDIGALCGFQEMSYFAKVFKAQMGCTPSEYRKKKLSEL